MAHHMNPGHPAAILLKDNWEVILAALVFKQGKEFELTLDELEEIGKFLETNALAVHLNDPASIRLDFVPMEDAKKLAIRSGGVPN